MGCYNKVGYGLIKFCGVRFGGSRPYYYITNDESIKLGDLVDVPTGNSHRVAEVVEIEYFKENKAPIPLDKGKKIIGKVEKKYN